MSHDDRRASPEPRDDLRDDDIDLRLLILNLWRRRWMVLLLAALGCVAGVAISLYGTRYVSEGLLLTPGVEVADYKRYEYALASEARLEQFFETAGMADSSTTALLRASLVDMNLFAKTVQPEFSFTDRDARQFGIRTEDPSDLVGIRLRLAQRQREKVPPVLILAEYVRDTLIKVDFESDILRTCLEYQTRDQELRNEQLEGEFNLSQRQTKAEALRAIMQRLPAAGELENRQIVSLDNGGERFLSPLAQLVGIEIEIADLRLAETVRERERKGAAIRRDYYCRARDALTQSITGRTFLARLKDLHAEVLKGQDLGTNVVEQTANALDLQREGWSNRYLARMRFVASPEGTQVRVRNPAIVPAAILGLSLGGLIGSLLALLWAWWQQGRGSAPGS